MSNKFTKVIGGKKITVNPLQEITKTGISWGASSQCPWCPKVFHATGKANAKRASNIIFDSVEGHWKTSHKNE